jgi:uncharacterized protein GlcG (DUF336 family)
MNITLEEALSIIDHALAEGGRLSLAPLTVAVLDSGGHLVAFKRQDGSGILRHDIAVGKAWGALGMGFNSREIAARASHASAFYAALTSVSQGRLLPGPGGVLIKRANGQLAGAVGISGDTGDNDEKCALAALEARGFTSAG